MAASNGINKSIDILNGVKDMRNFCPAGQWKHGSFFFANLRLPQLNEPFLCLRHWFNDRQELALEDYIETSLMLQYNGR